MSELLKSGQPQNDRGGDIASVVIFLALSLGSFGLGRLSARESESIPIRVMESSAQATTSDSASTSTATDITSTLNKGGEVVASKNGTKYYYPFCAAAQRLNPQSKITFSSEEAAKAAGYSAALNCSGMK